MPVLPDFRENPSNHKNSSLTQEAVDDWRPHSFLSYTLEEIVRTSGKSPSQLRVLDFGCGHGVTVGGLRQRGYQCFGVEIVQKFVDNANVFFAGKYGPSPIVSILDKNGRSSFPDGYFDVIYSNQVVEHVEDPDVFLREISRLMSPSGRALHIFPPRFCLIEPHMFLPIVHWFPKGQIRKSLIRLLLFFKIGAPYFTEFSNAERTEIFNKFSEESTFYRSNKTLRNFFTSHGLELRVVVLDKLRAKPGLSARIASIPVVGRLTAWLYGVFYQNYFYLKKL